MNSNEIWLIRTGIGPTKSRSAAQQLFTDASWDLVISTGFAGALKDSFQVGSLLLGNEVVYHSISQGPSLRENLPISCDSTWVNQAKKLELTLPFPIQVGRFVSVDRILVLAKEKQAVGRSTDGIAVDMESGSIAEEAERGGFPFIVIRAISDGVAEDLPIDFSMFFQPSTWKKGVAQLLLSPRRWIGTLTLYRNSRLASQRLSQFFKHFLSSIDANASPLPSGRCPS